jgi:rhamnose transport system substrate-binding protein
MHRTVLRLAVLAACGAGLGSPGAAAAWLGADDLPTRPLACDRGEAEAAAPRPYDGGVPVEMPPRAGEPITVVDVPRIVGVGYYDAAAAGMREAAEELGTVEVKVDGPTQISTARQVAALEDHVTAGVDGIVFAANDPIAVAPVLRRALAKGINVVGYDADVSPEARQWFVNRADPAALAKGLVDQLAGQVGDEGGFAIVTTFTEAPMQARWIAEMEAYATRCHPGLTWLGTAEGQDNPAAAGQQVQQLVRRHGEALKGIVALSYAATPGTAKTLAEMGQCADVALVGVGTPNATKSYFPAGCVRAVVLWNPVDLGYAAIQVLRAAADGTLAPGDATVAAGRLGRLRVDGSEVFLGAPFVFTTENVADFDF